MGAGEILEVPLRLASYNCEVPNCYPVEPARLPELLIQCTEGYQTV